MDYQKAIERLTVLIYFLNKKRILENQIGDHNTKDERTSLLVRLEQYNLNLREDYTPYEINNAYFLLDEYIRTDELIQSLTQTKRIAKMSAKYRLVIDKSEEETNDIEENVNIFIISIILYLQGGIGIIDYKNDLSSLILALYIIADKDKKREELNKPFTYIKGKK